MQFRRFLSNMGLSSIDFVNIVVIYLIYQTFSLEYGLPFCSDFYKALALSDKLLLRTDEQTYLYGCNYVKFTIYSDVFWKITQN